ncbi:hypothetical protein AVEN_152822-1 [Araneus ventricosus]|uniref:Uncharacterized protein n=1 Tax=Araneus ventricosus TaxID=182803 RepID=A0A4Y2TGW4_ARAVE|nr:hypothetical protein AVEN_152822-1 [Araneus ventricosus]
MSWPNLPKECRSKMGGMILRQAENNQANSTDEQDKHKPTSPLLQPGPGPPNSNPGPCRPAHTDDLTLKNHTSGQEECKVVCRWGRNTSGD